MKRRSRWLLGAGLFTAAVPLGFRLLVPAADPTRGIPVFTVETVSFTRNVNAEGVLKPVKSTLITAPSSGKEVLLIAWMLDDGDHVKKGEPVMRFDSSDIARRLQDGKSDRAQALHRIAKERLLADTTMRDRDRTAALTQQELAGTKELGKKDPRYFPRNEVIESEIDEGLYNARLDHAQRARQIEEKLAKSRMSLIDIERKVADKYNDRAQKALKKMEIVAPHDGTFMLMRWSSFGVLHAGDRAYPGMRLAEISDQDEMEAEVYVLEADAGGLQAGQKATVVLEARPDIVWQATVRKVEPFPKARTPDVPAQYFTAILALEAKTAGLKPGQRLRTTIVLQQPTQALVVPRQAVFRSDNDSVVFRRQGTRFEAVKVKLGSGTVGRLVITEGVSPGDHLALRDPRLSTDEVVAAKGTPPGMAR